MSLRTKKFSRLNLENLECRENPAGAITTSVTAGVLTITGGDESSNFTVDFTGPIVFTANDGETFSNNNISGPISSIVINLGGGDDKLTAVTNSSIDVGSGSINIDMGDGNNELDWGGLTKLVSGPITYNSGDGSDNVDIEMTDATSTITGAVTVKNAVGDLNFVVGTTSVTPLPVTGGFSVTNNYGNAFLVVQGVNTPKVAITGNDANFSNGLSYVQSINSKITTPITVTGNYGGAFAQITGGSINGVTLTSKANAGFQGTNFNYDSVGGVGIPTGNISLTAGKDASIVIDQTGVSDSAIGNLSATATFGSSIGYNGGNIAVGDSKNIGTVTAKSGTFADADINISGASNVGTVTATSTTTGDDARITLNSVAKVAALTATAVDGATIQTTNAAEIASATATGASASIQLSTGTKTGPVKATGTLSAGATINGFAETNTVTATAASAGISLNNVGKTAAITATGTSGSANVNIRSTTTGTTATKTGGNVTVTGVTSATLQADGGGSSVVNGNVSVKSSKAGAGLTVNSSGTDLTVEGTTTVTGVLGAALNLQFNTGDSIFNNAVSLTSTNPLFSTSINAAGNLATFAKNLTVKSAGFSTTTFSTVAISEVKGDYVYTGGQWDDSFNISSNFKAKNINWDTKNGNTAVTIGSNTNATLVPISGALTINSGFGTDTIFLNGVSVAGITTIKTGANTDLVSINNSTLTGASVIDTGAGKDDLKIGNLLGSTKQTEIVGAANYLLGAGNDTLTLGLLQANGGDAKSFAKFTATTSKVDGGLNLDTIAPNEATDLPTGATKRISFNP